MNTGDSGFNSKSSSALGRAPSRVVYLDKLEPSTTSDVAPSKGPQRRTSKKLSHEQRTRISEEQAANEKWRAIQAQRRASFESEPPSPVLLNAPGTSI